jgi:hypothetical protein
MPQKCKFDAGHRWFMVVQAKTANVNINHRLVLTLNSPDHPINKRTHRKCVINVTTFVSSSDDVAKEQRKESDKERTRKQSRDGVGTRQIVDRRREHGGIVDENSYRNGPSERET